MSDGSLYDTVRQKYVASTPEEQVRQAVLKHLIDAVKVPKNLIGVEYSLSNLQPGNLKKVDIVVWQPNSSDTKNGGLTPWLLVECKRPEVVISDNLKFQVSHYLDVIKTRYIWLTNGNNNLYLSLKGNHYQPVEGIPMFTANS